MSEFIVCSLQFDFSLVIDGERPRVIIPLGQSAMYRTYSLDSEGENNVRIRLPHPSEVATSREVSTASINGIRVIRYSDVTRCRLDRLLDPLDAGA